MARHYSEDMAVVWKSNRFVHSGDETYDWPKESDDRPVLQEEYTLTRLRLNVGLTEEDFKPSVLNGR